MESKSKLSRRSFLRFSALAAGAGALAACSPAMQTAAPPAEGGESAPAEASGGSAPAGDAVKVRVHCVKKEDVSDWVQMGLDQDIDGFKDKFPKIEVVLETIPGWMPEYTPKILSTAAGGTLGDMVWYPPRHRSHIAWAVQYDIVTDMLPMAAKAQYDMAANFYQGAIDVNTYEGKQYWMSFISEPTVPIIAYNKTKLGELGIPAPSDDWTFDELRDWAAKATTADHFGYSEADRRYIQFSGLPYLRQWGVVSVDKDGKKAQYTEYADQLSKALQFSIDLINDKSSPSPTTGAINDPEMYGGQKVLAVDIWPFRITIYPATFTNFETDFVLTPVVNKGDKRRSMLNEHVFGITKNSKAPDEAFSVLTWMCGKEMNVQAMVQGHKGPIARADVWADDRIYEKAPAYKKLKPVMDEIEADMLIGNWRGEEYDDTIQAVYDALELGKITPEQAIEQMQKDGQAVLDKEAA